MPANTPTPDARRQLEQLADEIPGIQQTLVANDAQLQQPDRGAHQQQLAGGRVTLRVTAPLPPELDGLGLFDLGGPAGGAAAARDYVGLGRISTGLGCPHIETNPDFLGLMVAFRAPNGRRVGRRGGIVDGDEIDASRRRLEGEHQTEKVGGGFGMRTAEAGRDAADPDESRRRRRRGIEDTKPLELGGQLALDLQQHLAAGDLLLVRAPIRLRQLIAVAKQRLLNVGNFGGQLLELVSFGWRGIEEGRHRGVS